MLPCMILAHRSCGDPTGLLYGSGLILPAKEQYQQLAKIQPYSSGVYTSLKTVTIHHNAGMWGFSTV